MSLLTCRRVRSGLLGVGLLLLGSGLAPAQTTPGAAESNYVKLLKKAPESRQGTIIEVIGKRGDAADLTYLLGRATAVEPAGFPTGARRLALDALGEAALTRNVRPTAGFDDLNPWIASGLDVDPGTRLAAIRLAGILRLTAAVPALIEAAGGKTGADLASRNQAFDSLATIGNDAARTSLVGFTEPTTSASVRAIAVAALARVDIDTAAARAAEVIAAARPEQDLAPLISPFLDRQGGSDKLLAAILRQPPSGDAAKLALRAVGVLGRSDEPLVGALSKIAGIEADPKPPSAAEMAALVADVARQGNPARGERIFRRAEINCMKCHAIAGAAGGVGPELSAVGLSSPVDYIVNSILIPDQAIKEEYQTRVVLTDDGRVLQGIVVEEDDRRVILKDALGARRVVPTATIEDSKKGGSLMPKGLVATLTRAEFVDLVRFLAELGRPGPYAIRSTPTIQRWRALHPVPAALASSAPPDPTAFGSAVVNADPTHWIPIYAWTSGELPTAELLAASGEPVGIIQGELAVSTGGPVQLRFGARARPELTSWIDDQVIQPAGDGTAIVTLGAGTRWLTIRMDAKNSPEPVESIRVEVARVPGSPAQFSVVGGP